MAQTAQTLVRAWRALRRLPGGRTLFAMLVARVIPYTGTVHPRVLVFEPGRAVVVMRDRRRIRNHLGSVHAVALTNLGEFASGIALVPWLEDARGIVVELRTEFLRKARGELRAEGRCEVPRVPEAMEWQTGAEIMDATGAVVARVTARWRLAPLDRP